MTARTRTPEQNIADAKARMWAVLAGWFTIVVILSLIPIFALFVYLARWFWNG